MKDMIYIDLDNVYGNMKCRNDVEEHQISRRISWSIQRVKKYLGFSGFTKSFGNEEFLADKLKLQHFKLGDNIFTNTPVVSGHAKTCADGLITAEMLRDLDDVDRVILFSSDVDFYPICDLLLEKGKEVVVVSHGFANGLLRRHCSEFIPVQPYGLYWKDMKNTQFFSGKQRSRLRNLPSYKQLELKLEETDKEP